MFKLKYLTVFSLIFVPLITFGQPNITWINSFMAQATAIMGILVKLGIAVAMLMFIWGLVMFIAKSGNEQAVAEGKKRMIWGIVALFVIVSVWGLVSLLQHLTGIGGGVTPAPPQVGP